MALLANATERAGQYRLMTDTRSRHVDTAVGPELPGRKGDDLSVKGIRSFTATVRSATNRLVEHLWFDLGGCAGGTQLVVHLRGSSARACLMDADEYRAYLGGDEYEYHGGFFDSYHRRITVEYEEIFD